ncbi:hypothetical protein MTR67_036428 [Solanum verrucosum]|uniref:Uncharacterized protein n=1 Tax=Solanum verrucosum TaxID=315347 RepID=A0AAF0UBM8_SOLVR|nr:hypothetical protein MTR67_036428 [Solanum verrucosum]
MADQIVQINGTGRRINSISNGGALQRGVHESLEVQRKPGLEMLDYHYSCGRTRFSKKLEKDLVDKEHVGCSELTAGANDTRQREGDFTMGKTKNGEIRENLGGTLSGSRRGSSGITVAEYGRKNLSYTLTCKFEAQLQSFSCHITEVYAPNRYIERRSVLEEIGDVRETSQWRPTSNIPNCPVISSEEKEILQRNFEEGEVLRCLKLCAMDKAPGPDGFTMGFYIKCWEIVKHDIMKAFQNFHEQGVLERSFNATFIALIPKNKGATELRDFRPIS